MHAIHGELRVVAEDSSVSQVLIHLLIKKENILSLKNAYPPKHLWTFMIIMDLIIIHNYQNCKYAWTILILA